LEAAVELELANNVDLTLGAAASTTEEWWWDVGCHSKMLAVVTFNH